MGVSTDSWAAQVGTDGVFTGAITHLGYPIFFKENVLHKIYTSDSGAHAIQDTAGRGVQRGCHNSLAIVNETLYYKARSGICSYDGSLPVENAYAFGTEEYGEAVGGAIGNKYYVSMTDRRGERHLFVLDTAKNMWHREDGFFAEDFCTCRGELYAIDCDTKHIVAMLGSGDSGEKTVEWMAQTGEIGITTPDLKYVSRLNIKMQLDSGSHVDLYAQYDSEDHWIHLFGITGTDLRSFSVPVKPHRCDYMRLLFEGKGNCKVFSITKTVEQGSDRK